MRKIIKYKSCIQYNQGYDGESIETKIEKIMLGNEPIESVSPPIYTLRKEGVKPEHDIRTDKWEIAQKGMEHVTNKYREERKERLKAAEKTVLNGETKAEA